MIEETQENIVQSETPVAQVAGVTNASAATEPAATEPTSKWAGISNVEQSTDPDLPNTVAKDNSQAGTDAAPISKWAGIGGDDSSYADPTIIRDKELEIDLEDYTSYLGNDIYNPVGGIDALNKSRATNQSWYAQAGNMLGQAVVGEIVGGTVEGIGYVLDMAGWADIAKGEEGEWGNWLSDYGKSLREFGQESMPIYQVNEGEFDMGDSGWWFSNAVSVASSLSMLIPATGTVKALSFLGKNISKALGAINKSADIAAGMGKKAKWMANGISQAVVSRHIENHMEASGTFESTRDEFLQTIDPKTGVKFTEEEANKYASQAAASNYKMGWAMIMQDIPQYLAIGKIFNPRTMKMESALSKATSTGKVSKLKPWQSKAIKNSKAAGVTFLSEGAEESYQYYIAERGSLKAKLDAGLINEEEYEEELSATIGDTEMMTSAFWGGLGGNIFQAVGPRTQTLFKSKATRQSEANWAKMQAEFLENRGKSYEMMQKELAVADQNNDPVRRKQIINEMMIGMSLEALTVDQFEQHIESLANLAEMTAEEQAAYKEAHGIELDIELFKEYVPDAIRIANETKERYLKHLDKNDSGVAGMMASNDIHIAQFQERIEALEQEKSDMSEGFVGSSKMSTYAKEIPQKKALIKAYQRANEIHRANLSDKASKRKKKLVGDVIKNNEKYIESLENSIANDYKEKEDIHPETRMHNKRYAAGHQTMLEEKQDKEIEKILLEDGISFRQSDNAHLGSDAYKKERQIKQDELKVALIQDEKGADQVRKNIRDNNEYTDKEKKDLLKKVDARKKDIIAKKKAEDLKAAQVLHDKKLAEEAAAKQEANPGDLVDTNVAPIEENIEDEFSEEESDHVNSELEKSEKIVDESAGVDRAVKLLDTVASDGYKEWVANGKSKIDEEVGFVVSDYNGQNKNILKAIELFNKGVVNDFVYEYLPIKALVGNNPDVFTFLPTLTNNIAKSETAFDAWNKVDLPQRKVIIDLLKDGKPAKSKISLTTGGGLVMDKNEDGSPAKNILTDLDQVEDLDDIQLAITNKDGDLVDSDTRDGVVGFKGKKYMVTGVTDEKGNQIPYKGGLFLMVKKADGSPFPLRLNLSKHSNLQAEALTEVLAAVALGQVKLEQAITDLPKEVLDILEVNLVEELKIVEDGSIKDLINLLGYTSEQTKGKKSQLMFSKDYKSVLFGDGKVLSKTNLAQAKIELQEFLQTTKNINFNSELWKTSPEYREWVVGSGAISTNATTKGPMFATSKNWKTKVFVAPISAPAPAPKVEVAEKTPANTSEQSERKAKTEKAGITKGENGIPGFTGYYYNQIGGVTAINDSTKEAVQKRIEAKYNSENITVKPTSTKSEPETDAKKQERINRSKNSVEKSTMGLPGFEGVYYGIDGRTLTVNLSTKGAVNEWIDNKFKAEPKTNPMPAQKKDLPKTTPTQETSRPAPNSKLRTKLKDVWNSIAKKHRNNGEALSDMEWNQGFNAAQDAGGDQLMAHGMGKSSLASGLADLLNLFDNGIDPNKGRGSLDVINFVSQPGTSGGATVGGAYRGGPFMLIAVPGHVGGITNMNQIGGILVNKSMLETSPGSEVYSTELLDVLRENFPNVIVEDYSNAGKLTKELLSKPTKQTSKVTISELESTGFTYPFGKTDKSPAYYEGHPDYKIAIDGKKVTTFPWAESTSEANTSDNSQKVTSGKAVQDTKGTVYNFKTAAEARAKAKELAATQKKDLPKETPTTKSYLSENMPPTQTLSGRVPLEGVSNKDIDVLTDEQYKELVETGYTQYGDGENLTELTYSNPKTPGRIDIPKYKVNKNLKNQQGTKVYASTNGKDIQINPVTDQQDFYDYIEGKGDYVDNDTSRQKVAVMKELADQGYSPAKIRSILSSKKDMNTFLILHEQDHIDNNDKAVYWANGKDLMTSDKIKIETRATLNALRKIEASKKAITMATESKLSPDQLQTVRVISEIQEESKQFGLEEVTIDGVVHSVYVGQGKTLERQSNMVTRLKGEQSESNDAMKKGAAVGNFVDILARDIFGDTSVKSLAEYLAEAKEMNKGNNAYLLEVTEQEFDGLVRKISKVKTDLSNKGMTFVSEEVFVYREYNQEQKDASGFDGMGGTLDLVAVDRQGKMHIIDFKNIKYSEKNATFLASNIYGPSKFATKNEKWSAQQTVYADASYNKYGLNVSDINILPISATYEEKDGTISMDKFELTNDLIGTTPMNTSSLSDSIIQLQFDDTLQEKLDGMFSDKRDTPEAGDGLMNILNATDESRDKLSARVDKEVERLENKNTRSARRRRRSNDKNSQENLEANNNSRIFEADDLSSKLNNSQKTINDPKPGKDTGSIRKKCD